MDQESFYLNGLDLYLTLQPQALKLQAFEHSLSHLFQLEVPDDSSVPLLTNDFCKSKEELFQVLCQGFSKASKDIFCFVDQSDKKLHYQCSIQFPLEKTISFEIPLENLELNELRHAELHISALNFQIQQLEKQVMITQSTLGEGELISPCFSDTFNSQSFVFSNDNRTIKRNGVQSGQEYTVWGDKFLKRTGKQAFEVRIEDINPNFLYSNAIIGVNKIDYMGENKYKGRGCYNLAKERVFFERSEFPIGNVFFKGDIIRVLVDFEKLEVVWLQNGERITTVKLFKEGENFDLYPVVTLKYENEIVSFL